MEVITPEGEVNVNNVPERYMLMNRNYNLHVSIKNKSTSSTPIDFYLKYRPNGFKITQIPDNLKNGVRFSMSPNQDFSFELQIMPIIEGPLQLDMEFIGIQKNVKEIPVEVDVEVEREVDVEVEDQIEIPLAEIMQNMPKICANCQNFQKMSKYCLHLNQMKNLEETCEVWNIIPADQIPPQTKIVKRIEKLIEKRIEKQTRMEQEFVESEIVVDSKMAYMESINSGDSQNLETIITDGDIATNIDEINLNTVFFYFPQADFVKNKDILRQVNKYMDLSIGKTFLYINYPIKSFSDKEQGIIKEAINKFLPKLSTDKTIIIFNLEFIPNLGKPCIILGKDDSINEVQDLYTLFRSKLNEEFLIRLDGNIISGGHILEKIKEFCAPYHAKVINLALSGEFQENTDYFTNFMKVFN